MSDSKKPQKNSCDSIKQRSLHFLPPKIAAGVYHCARPAGCNLVGILLLDKTGTNVSIATSSSATNVKLTTLAVIVVNSNSTQDPAVSGPDSVLSRQLGTNALSSHDSPEVCAIHIAIHNNVAHDVLPMTSSAVRALLCR